MKFKNTKNKLFKTINNHIKDYYNLDNKKSKKIDILAKANFLRAPKILYESDWEPLDYEAPIEEDFQEDFNILSPGGMAPETSVTRTTEGESEINVTRTASNHDWRFNPYVIIDTALEHAYTTARLRFIGEGFGDGGAGGVNMWAEARNCYGEAISRLSHYFSSPYPKVEETDELEIKIGRSWEKDREGNNGINIWVVINVPGEKNRVLLYHDGDYEIPNENFYDYIAIPFNRNPEGNTLNIKTDYINKWGQPLSTYFLGTLSVNLYAKGTGSGTNKIQDFVVQELSLRGREGYYFSKIFTSQPFILPENYLDTINSVILTKLSDENKDKFEIQSQALYMRRSKVITKFDINKSDNLDYFKFKEKIELRLPPTEEILNNIPQAKIIVTSLPIFYTKEERKYEYKKE